MKNRNLIITFVLITIYIIFNNYSLTTSLMKYNNTLIVPISLLLISVTVYFLLPKTERKIRYKYEKIQNIIIILTTYFIIYFLSGLIFGYEYTIYKQDFFSLIKNIYIFILPIIFTEYIRNKLVVNMKDNVYNNTIISITFILMNLNIIKLFDNLMSFTTGFKYISVILLPLIVTNFVMTKISRIAGRKATTIYSIVLKSIPIALPIIPSIPWIISAMTGLILPMFIYFNLTNFELLYTRSERRYSLNNEKTEIPFYLITILIILFILKSFKYYPVAVLSDSMKDTFSKGDIVVVEKVNPTNIENIKEYDIIYYRKNNKYIIHRVVEIKEEDNKKIFITKGDNNNANDNWQVYEEDIAGIVKLSIPLLGYPAVWFNDALNS